jgi:hypothetical protein
VEEDLGNIGIRAWRRTAMDRDTWKNVLKEAEAHLGLLRRDDDTSTFHTQSPVSMSWF